ncbi:hypothetical protein [Paracidovorax citrulli]
MSKAKFATLGLVLCASMSHAFTLGEAEERQGRLIRAKMDADIAEAEAKARISTATLPDKAAEAAARPSDPAKDFVPYAFYQFGKRACLDVLFRDVLVTRCLGDKDHIDGWQLISLDSRKAVFSDGTVRRSITMGVAITDSANTPTQPASGV